LNETEDYNLLRKTINIHILNFDYLEEKKYHNILYVTNSESHRRYHEDFEFHYIELPKYFKSVREPWNKLDLWTCFLATADKYTWDTLPEYFKADPDVRTACEVLEQLKLTPEGKMVYDYQVKVLRDERSALKTAHYRGSCLVLTHLIRRKFGDIPSEFLSKVGKLNDEQILVLSERTLEAKTLEELFDGLNDKSNTQIVEDSSLN
jgi:hypothetical protein